MNKLSWIHSSTR